MNTTETKPTGFCVRCQAPFHLSLMYRITHICRQCKNKLVDEWQTVDKGGLKDARFN